MAEKIVVPRRLEDWFDQRTGQMTLRAVKFFELMTNTSNVSSETLENTTNSVNSISRGINAQLFNVQSQIGSGLALTIDTTGFTVDTTKQFTDQTEV